uniref:Carbonic anhydrase n=1 Tax=Callorhinchus milii TaxID=7868 RepID=A0A4W3I0Z2_CALMI
MTAQQTSYWGQGVIPLTGPSSWHQSFPVAKDGSRQSPVDIRNEETERDPTLQPLVLKYDPRSSKTIANNGHSIQVDFDDTTDQSVLKGGPVTGSYRLRQFHFHWGSCDGRGSEHLVDGASFAAELHLVHWNSEKYADVANAAIEPDGLAVVGVFLKIGAANPALQKLLDAFDSVQKENTKADFKNFDPSTLLPPCLDFWTYLGSLTTPPLLESVIWHVLKEPITVSSGQMEQFRSLKFTANKPMQDNFRPPQPLKGRKVRRNF